MESEGAAIGFGWVPNISGEVTKPEFLSRMVDGASFSIQGFDKSIEFRCQGKEVFVSAGDTDILRIEPIDGRGMCIVYDVMPAGWIDKVASKEIHSSSWHHFINRIDGCSDACNCTAMNSFIYGTPDKLMYDAVARRFIQALENIADVHNNLADLDEGPQAQASAKLQYDVDLKANLIYFNRFVDLFRDDLDDVDNYESQVESRIQKADLIRTYHSEQHRISSSSRIEDLIGSIERYTEENQKSGKRSTLAAIVSAVIATISLVLTAYNMLTRCRVFTGQPPYWRLFKIRTSPSKIIQPLGI